MCSTPFDSTHRALLQDAETATFYVDEALSDDGMDCFQAGIEGRYASPTCSIVALAKKSNLS
ncbi:MAG: hypothetical protein HRT36_04270 [Alphaproteobacteria bacterium]|nr:hypothetical protein [Alphaproteobacteria bacterium]